MNEILDFEWFAPNILKISSKTQGLIPFTLRSIQKKYIQHLKEDFPDGIIRSISLKPRQAGWSTLIGGINKHQINTCFNEKGLIMADKKGRTREIYNIYNTFELNMPAALKHKWDQNNNEGLYSKALNSGFIVETAQDPNAGRSGTRRWAHLSEYAFYPYADSVDEGVQNSIPLAPGTRIFKESTAYGMSGIGASFFMQWDAAVRGDSIYKPFFAAWFEVDDYQMQVPHGFRKTKEEIELVKQCPNVTDANLVWRRLKIKEYAAGVDSIFSPHERFCQDFPSYPEEAFLSTGRPVFDQKKINRHINTLVGSPHEKAKIKITKKYLSQFADLLTVFEVPSKGVRYSIGADVAEGVETGDFSHACVLDEDMKQVAVFHGHIDPDIFGRVLVELATIYNNAIITPEVNNMGHTTLNAIKDLEYYRVYIQEVFDEISHKETTKIGWRTTRKTKQDMLNRLISHYRENEILIRDVNTLREMAALTRESDGNVILTGKDRVVGVALACMGRDQVYSEASVSYDDYKKPKILLEKKDLYRELDHERFAKG